MAKDRRMDVKTPYKKIIDGKAKWIVEIHGKHGRNDHFFPNEETAKRFYNKAREVKRDEDK